MEKFVAGLSYDFLSCNSEISDISLEFGESPKTLFDSVKYLTKNSDSSIYFSYSSNDDLKDRKVRIIAQELAKAVDKNSVEEIKSLKKEYGECEEFVRAKKFLNNKCKEIWNVYDSKLVTVPFEAMKMLGISNKPSLDFLLGNSIRYFERDNGYTTVSIIKSILNNRNFDYTKSEIFDYLVFMHKKEKCQYNLNTAKYLVESLNFTFSELKEIGYQKETAKKIFHVLDIRHKTRFLSSFITHVIRS